MRLVSIYDGLPLVASPSPLKVTTPDGSQVANVEPPVRGDSAESIARHIYFWSQHAEVDSARPVAAHPALSAKANVPSIGWTEFSFQRQQPRLGRFDGQPEELLDLIHANWRDRRPGTGRDTLDEVVRVPMPPERFRSATATLKPTSQLRAVVERRRPHEDPYIKITTTETPDPARFAEVVLYSARLLAGDVEPQFASDWGITAVLAGADAAEPMHPITMARNFLRKPGGTFAPYTADEFIRAADYWSKHAQCS